MRGQAQLHHRLYGRHLLSSAAPFSWGLVYANVRPLPRGVKRAYFARRVLPIDPTLVTYVVAIDLTWWARWRNKGPEYVQALLKKDWPGHVFICALTHELKVLRKKVAAVEGAAIPR